MNGKNPEQELFDIVSGKKKNSDQELFEIVSGKKEEEKRKKEKIVGEALLHIIPKKKDELVEELANEIEKIGKDVSIKKASALGLSLKNLLDKKDDLTKDQKKEIKKDLRRINKLSFREISKEIVDQIIDETDENYTKIYSLSIGLLYKFIKEDLKVALQKELDRLEGKVAYYDAKYSFGGDAYNVSAEIIELEEEIERLKKIIEELLKRPESCPIYKSWGDFGPQTWGGI